MLQWMSQKGRLLTFVKWTKSTTIHEIHNNNNNNTLAPLDLVKKNINFTDLKFLTNQHFFRFFNYQLIYSTQITIKSFKSDRHPNEFRTIPSAIWKQRQCCHLRFFFETHPFPRASNPSSRLLPTATCIYLRRNFIQFLSNKLYKQSSSR